MVVNFNTRIPSFETIIDGDSLVIPYYNQIAIIPNIDGVAIITNSANETITVTAPIVFGANTGGFENWSSITIEASGADIQLIVNGDVKVTTTSGSGGGGGNSWNITGNTISTLKKLGSLDNVDWSIIRNNISFMTFLSSMISIAVPFSDSINTKSIDVNNRRAYDSDLSERVSIDWEQRRLLDNTGDVQVDYQNRILQSAAGSIGVDWGNRKLYTGSQATVDWANYILYDGIPLLSLNWMSRKLYDSAGNEVATWNNVTKGIEYTSDWSATYSNRSLVDKEYVDSIVPSLPTVATTVTSNTTLTYTGLLEQTQRGNSSAGIFTTTLPTAVGHTGYKFVLKKVGTGVNAWTIACNGAETIDGSTTIDLIVQNVSVTLQSDGANWIII